MLTVDCKMGCIRHLRWCFGIRPRRGQIDKSRVRALRHGGVWCWTGNYMLTELQDECAKAEESLGQRVLRRPSQGRCDGYAVASTMAR